MGIPHWGHITSWGATGEQGTGCLCLWYAHTCVVFSALEDTPQISLPLCLRRSSILIFLDPLQTTVLEEELGEKQIGTNYRYHPYTIVNLH